MSVLFTDREIAQLLAEDKPMPRDAFPPRFREKGAHKEASFKTVGGSGNSFRVIFRQNMLNPLDFSVILVVSPADGKADFRLRRYNGRSHEHTNHIEGDRFYDFHRHTATERYQLRGTAEDGYAEVTATYSDLRGAFQCMVSDCGFVMSEESGSWLQEELEL